jgi:peroxidase
VVEAYDDIRMMAARNIQMDDAKVAFLNDVFSNLNSKYGAVERGSKNFVKMLSNKQDKQTKKAAFHAEQYANVMLQATRSIVEATNNPEGYENYKIPAKYCPKPYSHYPCNPDYPYRSFDGSCNNLERPYYGAAFTPYKRLHKSEYDDGVSAIRENSQVKQKSLPGARQVAITLHKEHKTSSVWSNFMVSFGQQVAHDLTKTYSSSIGRDGSDIKCDCNMRNDHCYNVSIPEDDKFYNEEKKLKCLPVTRSLGTLKDLDCNFGPREQLNRHTHFLDLSVIYSENPHTRRGTGGQLRFSVNENGEVIFPLKSPSGCPFAKGEIFHTSDEDGEQNIYVTGEETLWLRNHNQLAEALARINLNWDDETLFQQARRINTAMYQHIVYNEYLPALIGPSTVIKYDLAPLSYGYYKNYSADIYPQILNEFASAAFRHHYLVNNHQCNADQNLKRFGCHDLFIGLRNSSESCFNLDAVIRGLVATSSYFATPQISFTLNNMLLRRLNSIGTLNVIRGREHGIPGYNVYRELCGLNRATSFDEFHNIPAPVRAVLKSLYHHVDDVDLFSGGASELPLKDGMVGHTFSCIIAKQFSDLKRGDRFYYENGQSKTTRFTPEQLSYIRSQRLADIICRNVDTKVSSRWPFLSISETNNPLVECRKIAFSSLSAWKEVTETVTTPAPSTTTSSP